ncbi:MAG: rod shape-determining protein RodA [Peptostreptococcales bacterium]
MISKHRLKDVDFILLTTIFILFIVGIIFIGSTSYDTSFIITKNIKVQLFAFALGIGAIILLSFIDYKVWESMYRILYLSCIGFLLLVYIPGLGQVHFGARSWISLGPLDFQPSEIVKIIFILTFSKFLSERQAQLQTFRGLLIAVAYSLPIIFLILIEPDLGNAAVLGIISFIMIFAAGLDYKIMWKSVGLTILSVPLVYRLLETHQKIRIDAFLNPNDLSLPGNYHVWNSKVAIGSGNFLGKGLFSGTQKKLKFLPVQESDFIFAVLCEELGFLGGFFVILLYALFLMRLTLAALRAKDTYGRLVITGITGMFAFQIFENIGMTMGIMPVTGITLPFISYGGSSLLTNMIAIGIVISISIRQQRLKF